MDNHYSQKQQPNFESRPLNKFTIPTWISLLIVAIAALLAITFILRATYWTVEPVSIEFPKKSLTDTSNWQTYRNDKYGFEVRYPEYWRKQQLTGNTVLELITEFLPEGGDPAYVFGDHLTISIEKNVEKLTLKELVDLEKRNFGYIFGVEKYGSLDSYKSFEGRVNNIGMSTLYKVLIIKDDQIFDISYEYFYEESLERFNQILSTFKFIE